MLEYGRKLLHHHYIIELSICVSIRGGARLETLLIYSHVQPNHELLGGH